MFNTHTVNEGLGGVLAVDFTEDLVDSILEFITGDLAHGAFVATAVIGEASDAVFVVAAEPGLDGSPSKLTRVAAVRAVSPLATVAWLRSPGRGVGIVAARETMSIEIAGGLAVRARHLF